MSSALSPSAASTRSVPSLAGSAIVTRRARVSVRRRRAISSSRRARSISPQRRTHFVQGLELLGPGCRRLVEARIFDRHARLAGEGLDQLLSSAVKDRTPSRPGRDSRRRGRESESAHRGNRALADGAAGSRRNADRRPATRAAASGHRRSARRGCRGHAEARRSWRRSRRPCRCERTARAPFPTGRSRRGRRNAHRSGRRRLGQLLQEVVERCSELSAMPASTSPRKRSVSAMPRILAQTSRR